MIIDPTRINPSTSPLSITHQAPLTINQLSEVHDTVDSIISNLDEGAMMELSGGYQKDVDEIFNTLFNETAEVLASNSRVLDTGAFQYLDRFTESIEETLRSKSLNYFVLTCLPDFILGYHNIEWFNLAQIHRKLGILAARDHSKSYSFSYAYPLWQMYRYKKPGSNLIRVPKDIRLAKEGMLVTNEFGLGTHLMSIVKSEIDNNDILRARLMPDSKRMGWGASKIETRNGASFEVKSATSKIRGHHPTWLVLDDFLNDSSLYSQDQRDKYWNIFSGVLMPALTPGGQMIVVGTPFMEKDLYGVLRASGEFPIFEYPAIFPNGQLLFPQRHSFESIMEKKRILGSLIFSRELLVKPISDAAAIFPYDILKKSIKGQDEVDSISNMDNSPRKYVKVVIGCDFAISSSIGADYSVFTVMGVDELGIYHVLNCWRRQGASFQQQIAILKKMNRDFRVDVIYAEDNGMQQIFIEMLKDANLPVVGKTTNAANKKSLYHGVPAMAVLFETGRIKFPYKSQEAKNMTDLYFQELNSITFIQQSGKLESTSQHDDTSMSLWNACKACKGTIGDFDFSFI